MLLFTLISIIVWFSSLSVIFFLLYNENFILAVISFIIFVVGFPYLIYYLIPILI